MTVDFPALQEAQVKLEAVTAELKRFDNFDKLTVAQKTQRDDLEMDADDLRAKVRELKRIRDLAAGLKAGTIGLESGDGHRPTDTAPSAVFGDDAPQLPEWATKNRRADTTSWSKSTADQLVKAVTSAGRKAIVSGAYEVDSPIRPDILRLPTYPQRVLDLLVRRRDLPLGNVFQWLEQSVRTNNAASVPDTLLKPTSIFTFVEKEDRVRTIAHLSEDIPNRYLSDFRGLQEFLEAEMMNGLMLEVERQVLNGNGTPGAASQATVAAEDMRGLLNTPGIVVQPWSTDLLTTLRKAVTALEVGGQTPNAWAIHPNDVEVLDLLQDNEARHYFAGPSQQFAEQAPVWSIPIVKSVAVPAGQAILGDWNLITLVVRQGAQLAIDASGDRFEKNLFKARLEGRFGVYVERPSAFASVDLTA